MFAARENTSPSEGWMQVRVGDSVVVPGCGVGLVEAVESMDLAGTGNPEQLYRIVFEDTDQRRMWVPVDRVAEQNLRPVMTAALVEQTWEVIKTQEAPDSRATWNRRQRRYSEMLMSNSPRSLAELLGELAAVRSEKPLSFTEKRMFRQVWDLLVGEITASTGEERSVIEARMEKVVPTAAA
jgi:RNA polymerase-interacting CarD/CdnL/TRCF family regulator